MGVPRGRPGRASLSTMWKCRGQHRRQTGFRPVACRARRLALRKNQHRLLGAGTAERLLRRKHRLRAPRGRLASGTVGDIGMIRSLIAQNGHRPGGGDASLCHDACRAEDDHLPEAFEKTLMAKYFTSRAAVSAASDAVQIRGASGCHGSSPVSRYYRDAKIMEIIEGTTQIHEDILGKMFVDRAGRSSAADSRQPSIRRMAPDIAATRRKPISHGSLVQSDRRAVSR